MAEVWLLHGTNAGLCYDEHFCPSCTAGGPVEDCMDLFEHPVCGVVACSTGDKEEDQDAPQD